MSNALAIASVTAVLKDLLHTGMIDDEVVNMLGRVEVTARAPDLIPLDGNAASQLNLFLYQVTPNQGWRNVGLPSRDAAGERLTNPPLALDLHYLLTAYAAQDLHAEVLLGHGMQLLHETPVLTRPGIRRALAAASGGSPPSELADAGLADQVEAIKIVPQTMSTEEISKLWSAFQSRYRPSTAYLASVVLIETERTTRTPLPVRARKLYVQPFREPVVEAVLAQEAADAPPRADLPIVARHRLVLRGRELRGERTLVRVDDVSVEADAVEDREIRLALPSGLAAGAHGVQVVHERAMGEPPAPHTGVSSNLATFVLHPEVSSAAAAGGIVSLTVEPAVATEQRVVLLLNERMEPGSPQVEGSPRAYSFAAPARPATSPPEATHHIEVSIPGVAPGAYLVRIRVDGAESPLTVDAGGQYREPSVSVT